MSETFPGKAQASAWARGIEAGMDAMRFEHKRGPTHLTLKVPVDRYRVEIDRRLIEAAKSNKPEKSER